MFWGHFPAFFFLNREVRLKRNSKVDIGRVVTFPPLGLYIRTWTIEICNWLVAQIRGYGYGLDTPRGLDLAHFGSL